MFLNSNIFFQFELYNCSNLLDMRNLQEQVKKTFCYHKLFWPFIVWINCPSDLKHFANSRPSASNFQSFSWSLEQFYLTVGQNNFGNKIPFLENVFIKSLEFKKWNHPNSQVHLAIGKKNNKTVKRNTSQNGYKPCSQWCLQ